MILFIKRKYKMNKKILSAVYSQKIVNIVGKSNNLLEITFDNGSTMKTDDYEVKLMCKKWLLSLNDYSIYNEIGFNNKKYKNNVTIFNNKKEIIYKNKIKDIDKEDYQLYSTVEWLFNYINN